MFSTKNDNDNNSNDKDTVPKKRTPRATKKATGEILATE